MKDTFVPFRGIKNDVKNRLMCYKQDWIGGLTAGFRYIIHMKLCYKNTDFCFWILIFMIYTSMKTEIFLYLLLYFKEVVNNLT